MWLKKYSTGTGNILTANSQPEIEIALILKWKSNFRAGAGRAEIILRHGTGGENK